jgi:hypothetical protein
MNMTVSCDRLFSPIFYCLISFLGFIKLLQVRLIYLEGVKSQPNIVSELGDI